MKTVVLALCLFSFAFFVGCAVQSTSQPAAPQAAASAEGEKFLLAEEPAGAADVRDAREKAQDNEDVVVVGRIGGSENPWVAGRAAFSIVDRSLLACSDREGDNCPYPWDYCCETDKLPTSTAMVKVVDDNGTLVAADARELLGVKELQTVVVRGKAQLDEAGNLTVLASGLYIKP
jgi:hypothetical protein